MTTPARETVATIIHGRKALADNADLREAWANLLEAVSNTPLPARVAFNRYVRLVHGSTGSIVIPEALSDEDVDKIRKALASFHQGAPLILDELDVDGAIDGRIVVQLPTLELASDRPDRG